LSPLDKKVKNIHSGDRRWERRDQREKLGRKKEEAEKACRARKIISERLKKESAASKGHRCKERRAKRKMSLECLYYEIGDCKRVCL